MQFSIFHSLAEQRITDLIDALNDGRKKKEEYTLLDIYPLGVEIYLLSVYNEANGSYLFNLVNEFGEIPAGFPANFRVIQLIADDLPSNDKLPLLEGDSYMSPPKYYVGVTYNVKFVALAGGRITHNGLGLGATNTN